MEFARPVRRPHTESVVPMINVVFLLLIFFMISSELTAPDPFEVTPPQAGSDRASDSDQTLYVGADGALAWGRYRGSEVLAALAESPGDGPLLIRADAAMPAKDVAALLRRLSEAGITRVSLATQPLPQ